MSSMAVGTLQVKVMIREALTLKDKRSVIKGLKDSLRHHHNVSVAEVGGLDNRQQAILGFAMVSNDRRYLNGALSSIVDFIRGHPIVELIDHEIEIF